MKLSIFRIGGFAVWMVLAASAFAQAPTPEEEKPKDGTSYFRCFGELGERGGKVTYSLAYTKPKAKAGDPPKQLFNGINGGYCSTPGLSAIPTPSGRYTFTLATEGGGGKATLSEVLEPDAMYSLLATLEGTRPVLRLVREFPLLDKEPPGLTVHNLLPNVPLEFKIGEGAPFPVPYATGKSFFLPGVQITGPITAEFLSARGTTRRRTVEYLAGTKQIAVFFRNGFGQTTLSVFPAEPDKPDEEQPQ